MSEPYEPLNPRRERRRPRFTKVPIRLLLPNLITVLALCSGLTAVRMAIEGRHELAIAAIIVAVVLDAVDGRIARLLKGTSRFGAELDSLADFVNFGVVPGLVLYFWTLNALGAIGWIAALVLAISMALRLARFNVMLDDPTRPAWMGDFFVGMPAPAGAMTVLLPFYLNFLGVPPLPPTAIFVYVLALAALTISTVPIFSGKTSGMRVPREWVLPAFVVTVAFVALLVSYPWAVLSVLAVGYLAAIPFGVLHYRRLDARHRAETAAAARAAHEAPETAPVQPAEPGIFPAIDGDAPPSARPH